LILQLLTIIDQVSLDELGLRKKLKQEVERYYKFQNILGVDKQKVELMDVDIKSYAKHILKDGNLFEKRELLSHLKDKIIFTDRIITLSR